MVFLGQSRKVHITLLLNFHPYDHFIIPYKIPDIEYNADDKQKCKSCQTSEDELKGNIGLIMCFKAFHLLHLSRVFYSALHQSFRCALFHFTSCYLTSAIVMMSLNLTWCARAQCRIDLSIKPVAHESHLLSKNSPVNTSPHTGELVYANGHE